MIYKVEAKINGAFQEIEYTTAKGYIIISLKQNSDGIVALRDIKEGEHV